MDVVISIFLFVFFLAISVGWGFITKWKYSLSRLCTVAVCALIALIVALTAKLDMQSILTGFSNIAHVDSELLNFLKSDEILLDTSASFFRAFTAPLVFAVVFVALAVITWIINGIVFIVLAIVNRDKEKSSRVERHLGKKGMAVLIVAMAFLQCFITLGVLTFPVVAYTDCIGEAARIAEDSTNVQEHPDLSDAYESIKKTESNPIVSLYSALGGKALGRSMTTMEIAGEKTTVAHELGSVVKIAFKADRLLGTKVSEYSEQQLKIMEELGDDITESRFLTICVGEIIYGATNAWLDENGSRPFLGIEKPKIKDNGDHVFTDIFDRVLLILRDDAHLTEALCEDLRTFSRFLEVFARNGLFDIIEKSDHNLLAEMLNESKVVKEMVDVLRSNNSFKILVNDILHIGMRAIGSSLDNLDDAKEIYTQYKNDIAEALNELLVSEEKIFDVQKNELVDAMEMALDKSGLDIKVDETVLDLYAEMILNDFEGYDSITADDVAEYFGTFSDILDDFKNQLNTELPTAFPEHN